MSENNTQLVLPIQVSCNKALPKFIPVMIVASIVITGVFFVFLSREMPWLPYFYFAMSMATNFLLMYITKPRLIDITPQDVTITPIPILGYTNGAIITRPISDFESIQLTAIRGKGVRYWVSLHEKPLTDPITKKKQDISFDPPPKTDMHDFVRQLGTLLNLKVIDDARN